VAFDDDLVDVARLGRVQSSKAKVVHDQQVRRKKAPQCLLAGVIGLRLFEFLEHLLGPEGENRVTSPAGGMAEAASEQRLSHAHGAQEQHVLGSFQKAQAEEVPDPIAVEGDGGIPIEVFQRAEFLHARFLEPCGKVGLLPAVDFILQGQLQEVFQAQLGFLGIGRAIRERGQHARELQSFQDGFEGGFDLHRW